MCSIGDDVFENESDKLMPLEETILSKTCIKCRTEPPCIVLRDKDSYCEACFLAGTTHKFKALLGKSRLIRPKDRVLIYHKVGHPSTALLHFLRAGLDLSTPKKLRFEPVVLFIDDQYHLSLDERLELLKAVEQEIKSFGFKGNFVSFAEYVSNPAKIDELILSSDLQITQDDQMKLSASITKKCTTTSRKDIEDLLRRRLLLDVAKSRSCKFIFTPEISVDTASQLLTNISLGRGSHIPNDTGFCDDRDDDVKILRPLRLFDMKELVLYNEINNSKPLSIRQPEVNPYSSVQDLMKKFVSDLQVNFPSTVNTILKTGDKLAVAESGPLKCKMCQGMLLKKSFLLTSEDSTNFSHLVSTRSTDNTLSRQDRFRNVMDEFDNGMFDSSGLCYACSKISDYLL
nr:cytoplasmic tRNA 2-thiolation protein 2 [Leptinotarsa decemlineata]